MLTDFDSFCESPRGDLIESPRGARACPSGDLFVGGSFLTCGGQACKRVAQTDGSDDNDAWIPTGDELTGGAVGSLVVFNGDLYAAGSNFDSGSTNPLVRFNTELGASGEWEEVGTQPHTGGISDLVVYKGKISYPAFHTSSNFWTIVTWDGTAYGTLHGSTGMVFRPIGALSVFRGELYAAGEFTEADGNVANKIAKFDETAGEWIALNSTITGFNPVTKLFTWNDFLIVSGSFSGTSDGTGNKIVAYNGTSFFDLGSGSGPNLTSTQNMGEFQGDLIYVGNATTMDGLTINRVARWNGIAWSAFGTGLNASGVIAFTFKDNLYIGGTFSTADGVTCNRIARWDEGNETFLPLGDGLGAGGSSANAMVEHSL